MKTVLLLYIYSFISISTAIDIIPPPPGNECKTSNGEEGLGPALREIINQIPLGKITEIYIRAVSQDPEVEAAIEYIESDEFKAIVQALHDVPQYGDILEYFCNELHFNAYYYLNSLEDLLGLPIMPKPSHFQNRSVRTIHRGFQGFLEDLKNALPIDKIKEIYKRRLETDEYLRLAVEKIGSDEFQEIGNRIYAMPEYKHMIQKLSEVHVDVDKILRKLCDFFGWKIPEGLFK